MGYHHLAVATRNMRATDRFYHHAMGFELIKVEVGGTPDGGWAKHFFYDTGGGELMAFWELHDDTLPSEFETGLSAAAGLPVWVNHVAFGADGPADLAKRLQRWLDCGYDVLEIDHDWCRSIYTNDPNGTMVEFCITTGTFDAADREKAQRALASDDLERVQPKSTQMHRSPVAQKVHEAG